MSAVLDPEPRGVLEFSEADHRYALDGKPLLSVTQCLHRVGLIDDSWFTEFGRRRGSLVHLTLELYDRGELDEDALDERLMPYLDAWKRFHEDTGIPGWAHIERRLADPLLRVAGTLDRLNPDFLADVKSGAPAAFHSVQLAGYALLAEANGLIPSARRVPRYGIYVRSNGTYSLQRYDDRQDLQIFQAAVAVANWQVAHGA